MLWLVLFAAWGLTRVMLALVIAGFITASGILIATSQVVNLQADISLVDLEREVLPPLGPAW